MTKIALLASYSGSLINFRGDMIRDWVKNGHAVVTCAPEIRFEKKIKELGADFVPVRLQRTGMNPIHDCIYFFDLVRLFRKIKPDIVLSYTIKPVIYGSLAAYFSSVPKIFSMITGAGYAFEKGADGVLKKGLFALYRAALSCNDGVFFQNADNRSQFLEAGLLKDLTKCYMINGSGINLEKFPYSPPPSGQVRFLLIARLIPEKGILEYIEAARKIKGNFENVSVQLLGPFDDRPGAIRKSDVQKWVAEGIIEYLGRTDDVRPFLNDCSVYVLPSYHEGMPRSVLEALATGRPVITTNSPGCKETVCEGKNGFLVPVRDSEALYRAMKYFVENPQDIPEWEMKAGFLQRSGLM